MGFRAFLLEERDGKVAGALRTLDEAQLPEGDVTVAVTHSTLNYKDGLILAGLGRLVRSYPHVPGIDFAGVVESSRHPGFAPGDEVVLTGWRVGELHWGGYAEKARVRGEWLVKLPAGATPAWAMALGTAGFTAMLAVMELERAGLDASQGEVLVTGAAGGLGSVAIALLARLGCKVAASTGRAEHADYLAALGATRIVSRAELLPATPRPLGSETWNHAIDSVGGKVLATLLSQLRHGTSVIACGNAGGNDVPANVLPFLLRGVRLVGIDSSIQPLATRRIAWDRLHRDLPADRLAAMTRTIGLAELPAAAERILEGGVRGRIVIDLRR